MALKYRLPHSFACCLLPSVPLPMLTHTIPTTTHGRYLVDRPAGDGPFPLLVGFHGYKESAEHMLAELVRIRGARGWLLASVQALNRFYDRDNAKVIAGWMTRQDREFAIADNIAYVASVVRPCGAITRRPARSSTPGSRRAWRWPIVRRHSPARRQG